MSSIWKLFGIIFLVFVFIKISSEHIDSQYSKDSNEIFMHISEANKSYKPCFQDENPIGCYLSTLNRDLEPFRVGITKSMIDSIQEFGTKYQIVGGRVYRSPECMFPARCSGIEHFLKKVSEKLPNTEVIINCRDWPQIPKHFYRKGPIFSFSKTDEYLDIMYPAWGFWEGGPAISLYPTGIGRWDKHRKSIAEASIAYPWEKKASKGFFRGSRTSDERDSLVLLSRKHSQYVDAQYTKNQAWKSEHDTLNVEPASEVSFEDHCKYKYLFNFRGVAASFRFKHLFLCKSLVFHVGDAWKEFFYDSLKPWVHYVPLKSYPTEEEFIKIIDFFKSHDDLARKIAENGFEFVWNNLRMEDVQTYWETLLREYAKLLKYKIELDKKLIEIK